MQKITILDNSKAEILIENSKFIAEVAHADSQSKAKDFIQNTASKHLGATHNVPAYIIGHSANTLSYCSDDGEPKGTAGRPILAVLNGSGLGDICAVVTRYFGGKKLGKGGLVRAYTKATQAALSNAKFGEKVLVLTGYAMFPYTFFDQFQRIGESFQIETLEKDFQLDATINFQIKAARKDEFSKILTEISGDRIILEFENISGHKIFPLKD